MVVQDALGLQTSLSKNVSCIPPGPIVPGTIRVNPTFGFHNNTNFTINTTGWTTPFPPLDY